MELKLKNYREILENTIKENGENIAYKYKKDRNPKSLEIVEKTYNEFGQDIKRLGTALLYLGLEGKNISVISDNRYEWCVTYLAATTSNMTIVPLDKALPENEIESLILRSKAEAVVFEKKYEEIFLRIKANNDTHLKYLICMDDTEHTKEIATFEQILEKGQQLIENGDNSYDKIVVPEEKISIMLFTSGTTNAPKAVMLTQKNICSNLAAIKEYVKINNTDVFLSFLPLHHTFESTATFLFSLYNGSTVAFCDGLKHISRNLQEYKVTVLITVPLILENMYKRLLRALNNNGKKDIVEKLERISKEKEPVDETIRDLISDEVSALLGNNLRLVIYGAAPMNKDTILGYKNLKIELSQAYGLTETSPIVSIESDTDKKVGSIGKPLSNLEVKIANADKDGIGEITVKGPNVMKGYFKNEEATKKVLTEDGWFSTGDYGYFDEDGFLFITGRKNDVIVLKNGKNVYPQELEFLINKISYVEESIVYSRDKDETDTMLCAKIVYNKDLIKEFLGDKNEEEYRQEVWKKIKEINETLPIYKHIKDITITTEPLNRTTTQKIKRFQEIKKMENND